MTAKRKTSTAGATQRRKAAKVRRVAKRLFGNLDLGALGTPGVRMRCAATTAMPGRIVEEPEKSRRAGAAPTRRAGGGCVAWLCRSSSRMHGGIDLLLSPCHARKHLPARQSPGFQTASKALEDIYGEPPRAGRDSVIDSLISCILSQNTNDTNSRKAWLRLKKRFPTWRDAAKTSLSRIEAAIRPGGLAPSKSRRIKAILRRLDDHYGEYSLEFLHEMDDEEAFEFLRGINGVGAKTAAVVLLFALARDVFPVDTHIHRLARRLGFAPEGATRDAVFEVMKPLVPKGKAWSLHINLIRFGRDRCRKRSPLCEGCPLRRECLYVERKVSF